MIQLGFEFLNPYVLLFLAVIPAFYFLYKKYTESKKSAALKFSTLTSVKKSIKGSFTLRQHLPFVLILVSVTLIIIGLADPQLPLENVKEGVNVVIVLDGSGSMSAQDYKPTRLEAAKNAAEVLVNSLETKDHAGVVLFESGATTVSYLTPFKEKTLGDLRAIEQHEGATALGDGLVLGVDMANSIPNKKKVVILLSDGVHNAGTISPDEAIQYAQMKDIQVNTVGMGSEEPVFLRTNIYGQPLYAELDEDTLIRVAESAGGKYYRSVDTNSLNEIFSTLSEEIDREVEPLSIRDWFLIPSVVALATNIYIIYGKYKIVV